MKNYKKFIVIIFLFDPFVEKTVLLVEISLIINT